MQILMQICPVWRERRELVATLHNCSFISMLLPKMNSGQSTILACVAAKKACCDAYAGSPDRAAKRPAVQPTEAAGLEITPRPKSERTRHSQNPALLGSFPDSSRAGRAGTAQPLWGICRLASGSSVRGTEHPPRPRKRGPRAGAGPTRISGGFIAGFSPRSEPGDPRPGPPSAIGSAGGGRLRRTLCLPKPGTSLDLDALLHKQPCI
jgi:hypothetical protein